MKGSMVRFSRLKLHLIYCVERCTPHCLMYHRGAKAPTEATSSLPERPFLFQSSRNMQQGTIWCAEGGVMDQPVYNRFHSTVQRRLQIPRGSKANQFKGNFVYCPWPLTFYWHISRFGHVKYFTSSIMCYTIIQITLIIFNSAINKFLFVQYLTNIYHLM